MIRYLQVLLLVFLLSACSGPASRTPPLVAVLLTSNDPQTLLFKAGLQDAALTAGVDLWFAEVGTNLDLEDRNVTAAIARRPFAAMSCNRAIIAVIEPDLAIMRRVMRLKQQAGCLEAAVSEYLQPEHRAA